MFTRKAFGTELGTEKMYKRYLLNSIITEKYNKSYTTTCPDWNEDTLYMLPSELGYKTVWTLELIHKVPEAEDNNLNNS